MVNHKVIYDSQCRFCVLTKDIISKIDNSASLDFIPMSSDITENGYGELEQIILITPEGDHAYGFRSILKIVQNIPVLYFLLPLFYFLNVTGLGQIMYSQVARRRYHIPETILKIMEKIALGKRGIENVQGTKRIS